MYLLRIFTIILFSALLFSCNREAQKEIVSKYPDGSPRLVKYYIVNNLKQKVFIKETEYYEGNIKKVEGCLKNNLKEGKWTYWYKNGNKWSEGTFKNGLSNGKFTIWKEDGKRDFVSSYKFGKPNGKWMFWDSNGKVIKVVYIENGNKIKEVNY